MLRDRALIALVTPSEGARLAEIMRRGRSSLSIELEDEPPIDRMPRHKQRHGCGRLRVGSNPQRENKQESRDEGETPKSCQAIHSQLPTAVVVCLSSLYSCARLGSVVKLDLPQPRKTEGRDMRRLLMAILAFAALAGGPSLASAHGQDLHGKPAGSFDYYVLTLTWVPGFCAGNPANVECSKGLGIALHGLWPQFNGGDYPTGCTTQRLTDDERAEFAPDYPDPAMIDHEWLKHGTCSGLSPADYYALSTADETAVTIPDAYRSPQTLRAQDANSVKQAFLASNSTLPEDGIHVVTNNGVVLQIEICFTKQGAFQSCV